MLCPDELTLDLWANNALPSDEAALVAAHVHDCHACTAAIQASQSLMATVHAALTLDPEEAAYLSDLRLPSAWVRRPSTAPVWGWIALSLVVGGYFAWQTMAATFGPGFNSLVLNGLGTLPVASALDALFGFGQSALDVALSPALTFSQPLLVILACVLLLRAPRLTPTRSLS